MAEKHIINFTRASIEGYFKRKKLVIDKFVFFFAFSNHNGLREGRASKYTILGLKTFNVNSNFLKIISEKINLPASVGKYT